MPTPRFVRFCRALALVGGPVVAGAPMIVATFVVGCSSSSFVCGGCLHFEDFDAPPSDGNSAFDLGDTSPAPDGVDGSESEATDEAAMEADAFDTSEAGDGGPGEPPDLPFFAA